MSAAPALLSVIEAARAYRVRDSVIRSLCRLGKLKNSVRPGRGRTGMVTWIDAKDAARVLGAGK